LGLWAHPKLPYLYAGLTAASQIGVFRWTPTGKLSFVRRVPTGGAAPCWVRVNRAGTRIYVSDTASAAISVFDSSNPAAPVEIQTLALDAAADHAPAKVFDTLSPDVMVVCGGAIPTLGPVHDLTWEQFAHSWQTDVKMSFLFCGRALRTPLAPGSTVILISSGAGIGGSPISGSYAGAKRMQMFLASYCQKESARLGLGIRFAALVPMRLMPETELGKVAIEGYARYLGMKPTEFMECMTGRQSVADVAAAVVRIATERAVGNDTMFAVSAAGIARLS